MMLFLSLFSALLQQLSNLLMLSEMDLNEPPQKKESKKDREKLTIYCIGLDAKKCSYVVAITRNC
jgi:hypothetical protein